MQELMNLLNDSKLLKTFTNDVLEKFESDAEYKIKTYPIDEQEEIRIDLDELFTEFKKTDIRNLLQQSPDDNIARIFFTLEENHWKIQFDLCIDTIMQRLKAFA